MARCSCSGTCSCLIVPGEGIEVDGSGHVNDPYIITAFGGIGLVVQDTTTVDLALAGSGTEADPYILSANSLMSLTQLHDRSGSPPNIGDVPIWQNNGTWSFGPPPVAPAGATNTANGIRGVGTVADPVAARTSGTWGVGPLAGLGSDTTIGQVIYVDSLGDLRAAPATAAQVEWSNISGVPAFFNTRWDLIAGVPSTFASAWSSTSGRPRMVFGSFTQTELAPGVDAYRNLTFANGVFNGPPIIFGTTSNASLQPAFAATSATAARCGVTNVGPYTQGPAVIRWMAIQPPNVP